MKIFCFALVALLSVTASASANELRRLEKCYGIMVKERILKTDPLWVRVANGSLSGTDACMQVFDKAQLGSDGKIAQSGGVYDSVGAKVLASFLEFYRSQFTVTEFFSRYGGSNNISMDVIDANEPSYHYLYPLFRPNESFSSIVTRNYSFKSFRFTNFPVRTQRVISPSTPLQFLQEDRKFVRNPDGTQTITKEPLPWAPIPVQTGTLVGITIDDRQNLLTIPPAVDVTYALNKNVNETFGGGVIGTQAYFAGNNNKSGPVSGGANTYRLWSKSVMQDLLCRTLPALRSSDAMPFVNMNSSLSFQKGSTCQQCHANMDPMAGVARQLRAAAALRTNNDSSGVRFFTVGANADTQPAAPFPSAEDSNFSKRPANGTLRYRSYSGELIEKDVTGIQGLGEALAKTDDLYVCAAKKLYQHLVGRVAPLVDPTNPLNPVTFTLGEQKVRNDVINLGMQLKQHQTLRTTIKDIIASDAFLTPDKN